MAEENVVIRIVGDVTDLNQKLTDVKGQMGSLGVSARKVDDELDKAFDGKNVAKFEASAKRVNQTLHTVGTTADRTSDRITRGIGGAFKRLGASIAASISVGAFINFMKSSIAEAKIAEQTFSKLNAVLKSTGGVSGMTATGLKELATRLSLATAVEDDAIMNAEALLLTFKQIGSDIFPQATEAVLDMSVVLGQDLQSSAIQLGKALNDPIAGVTALRRVGIQLSDQQEAQIKTFMKSNDVLSAQKIILKEVESQMGGVARQAAMTDAGKIQAMTVSFGELREALGARWQKDLAASSGVLTSLINDLTDFIEIPVSEKLAEQHSRVNALTFALANGNLPAEERNKIYNELKEIAPEVVKGIDAENVSVTTLKGNLAEFNKQAINRLVIAQAYEDVQNKQKEASKIGVAQYQTTIALLESIRAVENDAITRNVNLAKSVLKTRDAYQNGKITLESYAKLVKGVAETTQASDELSNRFSQILTNQISSLTEEQKDFKVATDKSAESLINYNDLVKKLGINMDDVNNYIDKNTGLTEEQKKLQAEQSEQAAKAAEEARKERQKNVDDYNAKLKELKDATSQSEIEASTGLSKILAEGNKALFDIAVMRQELLAAGVKAYGASFQLTKEALDAIAELTKNAQQKILEETAIYHESILKQKQDYQRQAWEFEKQTFETNNDFALREFKVKQQLEENLFKSVQQTSKDTADFEKKQADELIKYQVELLNKQIEFLKSNESKGIFDTQIKELELRIQELLADLGKSDKIKEGGQDFFEKLLKSMFPSESNENISKIKDAFSSIFSDLFSMVESDMAAESDAMISAIDRELSKIDELLTEKQRQVDEETALAEQGKANNLRIRQDELNGLIALQQQEQAAKDEAIKKAKEQERTMATIKAATAFIVALATAVETEGALGIVTGLAAGVTLLAYIASAYGRAEGAVTYGGGTAQILGGKPHSQGGTPLGTAEKGEFFGVLRKDKTPRYGKAMMSLFDGINNANESKRIEGLAGLMGVRDITTTSNQTVELGEVPEIRGIYSEIKKTKKTTTYDKNKRIEKFGNVTRTVYVN